MQRRPANTLYPSAAPAHLSAGVHRKTKVYMDASNSDCIAPSSAILGSAGMWEGQVEALSAGQHWAGLGLRAHVLTRPVG